MPPKKASSKELVMATCYGMYGCGMCEDCKYFKSALNLLSRDI